MGWAHAQEPPPAPHPGAPCWQPPSSRGPSGSGSTGSAPRGPGDEHSGGPWAIEVAGAGSQGCIPPASAALLPCCHSNALRPRRSISIPQHRACSGGQGRTAAHCPCHTAPDSTNSPAWPHTPSPRPQQPHAASAFLPGAGGYLHSSQCCPKPTQQPQLGGLTTWRGP